MTVAALYSEYLDPRAVEPRDPESERSGRSGRKADSSDNQGRVRSSRVGFRIGPLGLTYTHRSLDLDSEELDRLARAFERLVAKPKPRTAPFLTPDDLDQLTGFVSQSREAAAETTTADRARRRGAEAYATVAAGVGLERGRTLSVV